MSSNFTQCIPALRAVSFVLTGDRQRAVALVEKTIIHFFTDPRNAPPGASLKVWMLMTLHSLHFSESSQTRKAIHPLGAAVAESPASSSNPEVSLGSVEFRCAFWRLCDDEREALFLREAGGLSCEEVAKVCGCTTRVIETLALRARRKLERLLSTASSATSRQRRHAASEGARGPSLNAHSPAGYHPAKTRAVPTIVNYPSPGA
jgi:DNA-directed RNA polymerase specialized sigma24 family protein